MAETLGSLVDKLTIKNLRLWHIEEVLARKRELDLEAAELKAKRELVIEQTKALIEEINRFFALALEGKIRIRDQKLKMYQNPNAGNFDGLDGIGTAISELALRNIKLWHLEDEVRRTDIPDSQVVGCKRKIDGTNQERNDLIDKVDEILERNAAQRK